MPIKMIAMLLAFAAVFTLSMSGPEGAQAQSASMRTVGTAPNLGLRRVKYRVITTGAVSSAATGNKPKDLVRIVVEGLQLLDGDCLSFSLVGADGTVDFGSPTFTGTNPCLTLVNRRARAPIGQAPYLFPRAKLRFNPRKSKLIFLSGKGTFQANPVITALGKTQNNPITLIVHVRRPGSGDCDYSFNGLFLIKHKINRRTQLHVYRAVTR